MQTCHETAPVGIVEYDLLRDLPSGIGTRFRNSIHFTENDVFPIADAVLEKLQRCKSASSKKVFNIYIKGIIPYWMTGKLTAIFYGCDDVCGFNLLHPNGTSWWMFPVDE